MTAEGMDKVLNLVRCVWAGGQRYGALAWSGDIYSSFRTLREQLQAGLSMAIAGIPWWTTDIGGFLGGDIHDPHFHELLVRWFQWGAFCPVMRLHGERPPFKPMVEEWREGGVRQFSSGQDNEVWSFGEDVYEILVKYLHLRERLRPYIARLMAEPAFWYSIWFLKSPKAMSPGASRSSVPLIAGPIWMRRWVSGGMPAAVRS